MFSNVVLRGFGEGRHLFENSVSTFFLFSSLAIFIGFGGVREEVAAVVVESG